MSASQNTSTPATAAEQSEDVVTLISELESHAVWVPPQPAAVMRRVAAYLAKPSDEAKLINIALGLMNSPKGANLVQEVAKLIATPVVQGEPSIYECSGCGTVTRDPAKHIALLKKAGHISCCPDADYRATPPAPSPKEPT